MKTPILAVSLVLSLVACAPSDFFEQAAKTGGHVSEATQRQMGRAIDSYCGTVPEAVRLGLRTGVNRYATRGQVTVHCFEPVSGGASPEEEGP